jgi:hypothetical protein
MIYPVLAFGITGFPEEEEPGCSGIETYTSK